MTSLVDALELLARNYTIYARNGHHTKFLFLEVAKVRGSLYS